MWKGMKDDGIGSSRSIRDRTTTEVNNTADCN